MKKTAAILSAVAVMAFSATAAFAENGGVVGDVVDGAESIVDDVVSGAEDIIDGGDGNGNDSAFSDDDGDVLPDADSDATVGNDSSDESSDNSSDESSDESSENSMTSGIVESGNVNTGVPALELAALGTAAIGGLAAMAATVRRRK